MSSKSLAVIVLGFMFAVLPVAAQKENGPILIVENTDYLRDAYWLEQGELIPLSENIHALNAITSPDGRYIAIKAVAPIVLESSGCSGPIPSDMWLFNLETSEQLLLSEQPENVNYCEGDDNTVAHSAPTWSPNSTQIAWTQFDFADYILKLAVYDLAENQLNLIPFDFPEQYGAISPVNPYWIASGITLYSSTYNMESGEPALAIALYAADGTLISETPIWLVSEYGLPETVLLVTHQGRDYAAYHWIQGQIWLFYDLLTQENLQSATYPQLVSSANPEASLRVQLLPPVPNSIVGSIPNIHYQVSVIDSSGSVIQGVMDIDIPVTDMNGIMALSPDGQTLAYRPYDDLDSVYVNELHMIGTNAAAPFSPEGRLRGLSWGRQQWILPEGAVLEALPDAWG